MPILGSYFGQKDKQAYRRNSTEYSIHKPAYWHLLPDHTGVPEMVVMTPSPHEGLNSRKDKGQQATTIFMTKTPVPTAPGAGCVTRMSSSKLHEKLTGRITGLKNGGA